MKTVKLISMSEVKTEKQRSDNKVSRKYYTAIFCDPSNPFAATKQRNVFQSHLDKEGTIVGWKGGNPDQVRAFVGKEIPGQIVNCIVKPYAIGDRTANSYSTVLLDGENLATILKQAGHELAEEKSSVKSEAKAVGSEESLN